MTFPDLPRPPTTFRDFQLTFDGLSQVGHAVSRWFVGDSRDVVIVSLVSLVPAAVLLVCAFEHLSRCSQRRRCHASLRRFFSSYCPLPLAKTTTTGGPTAEAGAGHSEGAELTTTMTTAATPSTHLARPFILPPARPPAYPAIDAPSRRTLLTVPLDDIWQPSAGEDDKRGLGDRGRSWELVGARDERVDEHDARARAREVNSTAVEEVNCTAVEEARALVAEARALLAEPEPFGEVGDEVGARRLTPPSPGAGVAPRAFRGAFRLGMPREGGEEASRRSSSASFTLEGARSSSKELEGARRRSSSASFSTAFKLMPASAFDLADLDDLDDLDDLAEQEALETAAEIAAAVAAEGAAVVAAGAAAAGAATPGVLEGDSAGGMHASRSVSVASAACYEIFSSGCDEGEHASQYI